MCVPRVMLWLQLIDMLYFEDPRLDSPNSRAILHEPLHLSRSTAVIFAGWSPHRLWAALLLK